MSKFNYHIKIAGVRSSGQGGRAVIIEDSETRVLFTMRSLSSRKEKFSQPHILKHLSREGYWTLPTNWIIA